MLKNNMADIDKRFDQVIEAYELSLKATDDEASQQMLQVIQALRQNIQIMQRLQSDVDNGKQPDIQPEEVSQIGDYALNLLDEAAAGCASRGLQEQMLELHRLSIPVANWLYKHGGQISKLDIVVNAFASYANTLQDTTELESLCHFVNRLITIVDPLIRQDLDNADPMRPWRILNLNWGIVATRSHNTELMQQVFDQLIENLPADAAQFFREGLQQMEIIDYPQSVKEVMQSYAEKVSSQGAIH